MRFLRGRQARFLGLVLGGWLAMRAILLWPIPPHGEPPALRPLTLRLARPSWDVETPFLASFRPIGSGPAQASAPGSRAAGTEPAIVWDWSSPGRAARMMMLALGGEQPSTHTLLRRAVFAASAFADDAPSPPPAPVAPPAAAPGRPAARIEGQAYLFVRPGSGRALAAGGALGGSQAAARIAIPIDPAGRLAIAARTYAPLDGQGAEAALGLDWRPIAGRPLRLSIERRQRLDRDGRSAWSAYAAGGFYRVVPGGLVVDGYAQAGMVGLRARDLFADGALRLEKPVALGPATAGFGLGAWGAAQPGARRIDVGPRAALRLPVADHVLSLAIEGRFRVTGNARPGSGLAVTLAADL